ncbi:hypothetical protein V5N11_030460 [Cardamine amara subsp. amara]|uniref:Uncharacterized protein n=1 Tax=Cardamine amara subsp. amara TaxID=228776 RepID=A0ABD0Z4H7_CARAN
MRLLKNQRSRGGGGRNNMKRFGNRRENVSSRPRIFRNCCNIDGEKFSEKLEALKSLLPPSVTAAKQSHQDADVEEDSRSGETEQLFQETADYIVRLRTQVVVLQKLIKIYGSSDQTEDDFVL